MEELEQSTKAPEPVAQEAAPTVQAPKSLDEALDAVWDSQGDPETEAPSGDAPQEAAGTENVQASEPVATKPPPSPEPQHQLTPEEEQLLRRNKASDDELAFYRGLTVEQRNKALKPLREAQLQKDRFWSLPKEERAKLAQSNSTFEEPQPEQAHRPEDALKSRLQVDVDLLKQVSEKEGIDYERLKQIEEMRAAKTADMIAPIIRELEEYRQKEARAQSTRVIGETYTELSKSFPQIKDEKVWNSIVNDPDVVAHAQAIFSSTGDRDGAVRKALDTAVKVKFYNDIQTQAQRNLIDRGKQALRGTAERTSVAGRSTSVAKPKPKSVEEALDMVWESQND